VTAPAAATQIPVPEPDLTPAEMIARAKALIPLIREQQDGAEERGYYGEELHRRFVEAGFSRCLQPRRYGGYEFDLKTFLEVMVAISTGDPGTGWCLTLGSSHAWVVGGLFPEDVQTEVFAPDGDFRCPHPASPTAEATPVDGGYRITGKLPYASGIPYATWALGGALVPSPEEGGEPRAIVFLVPRRDLTMLDDWGGGRLLGMQSSGSNSYLVEDVFVPERFTLPMEWFFDWPEATTPGYELHGNPLYVVRPAGPYHTSLVAPVVGAARAALDAFRELAMTKPTTFQPVVPRYRFHDDQRAYGQATAMTDAAETILYGFADQYLEAVTRAAETGERISIEQDARWWALLQQAGGLAAGAVEVLAHRSTSSTTGRGTKLGRYFRDVTMYRQHISSQQIDFAVRNGALYLGATTAWLR
jgi:3-hydroxy-9,10-secoandrosta-1,3,5(10)-triene-9,17-dione monooxygenase